MQKSVETQSFWVLILKYNVLLNFKESEKRKASCFIAVLTVTFRLIVDKEAAHETEDLPALVVTVCYLII